MLELNPFTSFFSFGTYPDIAGLWKARVRAFEDLNSNDAIDSGERVSAFSDFCTITLQEAAEPNPVVLNEIFPDPLGDDSAGLPFGEWVELYNRSDSPVDVNGWVIYADGSNQFPLVVSSSNTFSTLPVGPGTTTIPSHGFVVVYRAGDSNFDMDNTADTVRLFNGLASSGGVLQDAHEYTSSRENKSITRSPDGADNWIDPIPTPGRPNIVDASQLDPTAFVAQQDSRHLMVALLQSTNYQTAEMVIEYARKQDGQDVSEAVMKNVPITDNIQFINDIFLGSVSSGTEYPHTGIHTVIVHVTLHSDHLPDKSFDVQMSGKWRSE